MDLKGLGYLISIVSVFFLGIVAWPAANVPARKGWAVTVGMSTSVLEMAVRYMSHRADRKDIQRAANDQQPQGS